MPELMPREGFMENDLFCFRFVRESVNQGFQTSNSIY